MQIGLGMAAIGRPQYINVRTEANEGLFDQDKFRSEGLELLNDAYTAGIRYFDTAPGYGLAEDLLTNWLKKNSSLDTDVGTKWGYTYVANFESAANIHEVKDHSVAKLREQWRISRELLPHLKYYQVHSATLESRVLDNYDVLNEMLRIKENCNIKIGITTSGANQTDVLRKALEVNHNWNSLFDVFQVTYNMLDQSIFDLKELQEPEKYTIILKEVLANGRIFRNEKFPHYNDLYNTLEDIADSHRVGVDAIALRFAMQAFPNGIALSGASAKKQLSQNLMANNISLSEQEISSIQKYGIPPTVYWVERKRLDWN